MTLPYSPSKAIFNGNSVATDFPFSFKVWNTTQLDVTISDPDGVASTAVGWTATLQSNGGGTVTYRHEGKPLPVGWTLAIVRNMKFSQEVDLINNTMFHAEVVEDQLDYATAERQQLKEAVDRSIKVPPTNPNPPELLADMLFEARDETLAAAAAAAISETAAEASATAAAASEAAAALILETAVAVIGEEKANALDSIESKHNAALDDIANSRSDSLGAISSLATERLTAITREGQLQQNAVAAAGAGIVASGQDVINQVVAEGDSQEGRVNATGTKARVDLVLEGDAQVNRVTAVGAEYVLKTYEEAQRATGQADIAKEAAERAVNLTGQGYATKTGPGLMQVGDGLKVDDKGRVSTERQTIVVSNPALTFPADVAIGHEYTLTMSATSLPGIAMSYFEVVFDGAAQVGVVANAEGQGSLVVVPDGVDLASGTISVIGVDTTGNKSLATLITFTKHAVVVRAPHVLAPLEGDTDVALLAQFQVQSFGIYGMAAVGVATQLQIFSDESLTTLVYDSGENHAYATTFTMTDRLPDGVSLWARARHRAEFYGWSAWGELVSFITIAKRVVKPRLIAPIAGAVDQPVNVAVVLSPIEVKGIAATPTHTRVIVARDEALTERIFDSGESAAYSTSVATNNLPVNTLLHVSGQHKDGELGWSELADVSSFTTLNAYTVTPTITSPTAAVDVELRPTFTFSQFANIGPVDTLKQRIFQVARDALFSDLVVNITLTGASAGQYVMQADLPLFSDLYARVQDEGNTWGVSEWSTVYSFKTLDAYTNTPSITFPAQGATGVGIRPTFTATAFSNTGPADTPDTCHWQLSGNEEFTDIVEEYNGVYKNTFTPAADLAITKDYWVRVKYKGKLWRESAWSSVMKFTTLTAFIHEPVITGITEGQTGVTLFPTINIGTFAVTPAGFDVPKTADSFAYSFKVGETVVDSGMKTFSVGGGVVVPATALPLQSAVVFSGHWVGNNLTGTSKSIGFTTTNAYVEKPVITLPSAGGQLRTANASVVTAPFASVGGLAHVSTDWKLTSDLAGNDIVQEALGSSDKLAHTFQHGFGPAFKLSEAGAWYWFGVTYGNGVWVAVGDRGKTSTSPDGKALTPIVTVSGMVLNWRDVTYANGLFVAVGDGAKTTTSTDGVTWTTPIVVSGAGAWQAVTYANGLFVAVGQGGMTSTSPDGKAWTPVVIVSGLNGEWWYGVTYGNGLFVVVGEYGMTSTSPDGVKWATSVSVIGQGGIWWGVTYGNGKFVAVGDYGRTSTSPDGVKWATSVSVIGMNGEWHWRDVTYANGMFVAVGDDGRASLAQFLPIDQTVYCWAKHNSDIAVGEPWSVPVQATVKESCFVAVGHAGKTTTSTDGVTWTPAVQVSGQTGVWRGVTFANGKFVAVGDGSKMTTSTDGVKWTTPVALDDATLMLNSIAYGHGKFVAMNHKVFTSTDGKEWTWAPNITNYWYWSMMAVAYGNGLFVAGGGSSYTSFSTDGVTWSAQVQVSGLNGEWTAMTYGNGKFVAGGYSGRTSTSPDGKAWTPIVQVSGTTGDWNSITFANGKFVAVGYAGRTSTSTDGVTWATAVQVSGQVGAWQGITFANGKFVAVGSFGITTTSTDGVTWTTPVQAVEIVKGSLQSITYG